MHVKSLVFLSYLHTANQLSLVVVNLLLRSPYLSCELTFDTYALGYIAHGRVNQH